MSDATQDLAILLDRLRNSDRQALAELFSIHRERLRKTVQFRLDRRLQGRIGPEDVLQESYLSAADRLDHFHGDSSTSFYVWLRMIVNQTMVDLHRRHLGAQARNADREVQFQGGYQAQGTSSCLALQLSGKLTSPSQAAMRDEQSRQLEQILEQMDAIDREVLALRHFEELTNSEVAEVLGIQQKAASIRYVRAIRRLKEILSKVSGFTGNHNQTS